MEFHAPPVLRKASNGKSGPFAMNGLNETGVVERMKDWPGAKLSFVGLFF